MLVVYVVVDAVVVVLDVVGFDALHGRRAGDELETRRDGAGGAVEGERHGSPPGRMDPGKPLWESPRHPHESALAGGQAPDGLVVTRSTPPRRRVADQLAGACRWYS